MDLQLCWPPTRGDLLARETPSRRGAAGHRVAEPTRESAGRRGRRRGAERGEPEGALGFAVAAASLGLGHWESGTRGHGDRGG